MPINSIIIDGQTVPRRRFTAWAWTYFLLFIVGPVLGIAALFDFALYFILFR